MLKFAVPDKPIQLVDKRERSADAKEGGTQSKPKEARRKLFFPKSIEQYSAQSVFPYSISFFRVLSPTSHFEQNN